MALEAAMGQWPPGGGAAGGDARWFVLHTRSRQEKALAADLEARGIAHYLPLVRSVRYYGRRKATVSVPLFPSYLFLRGEVEEAYAADRTRRLARVIPVNDQGRMEEELRNIHAVLNQGAALAPYPYLQKGVWVEVRSGPFRGVRGVIEDRTRADRLVLQVAVLGQATSLEIDGALLEPIERAELVGSV